MINQGPSIRIARNDEELIGIINGMSGSGFTEIGEALYWASLQDDIFIQNKSYDTIVTSGLTFYLDPSYVESYPKSGVTVFDLTDNNNGELVNGAFVSEYLFNFDGSNDYIRISSSGTMNGTSITFLVKTNNGGKRQAIFSGMFDTSIIYFDTDGKIGSGSSTVTGNATSISSLDDGSWHHVGMVNNGSNSYTIIVDGVDVSGGLSGGWRISDAILIGGCINNLPFDGKLSSILTYDRILSESEILQNYYKSQIVTSGLTFHIDADNLVSYESGSTNSYDMINNLTGTLYNDLQLSNSGNKSWSYDGVDTYMRFYTDTLYDTGSFTWCCWFYVNDDITGWNQLYYGNGGGGSPGFGVGLYTSNRFWFEIMGSENSRQKKYTDNNTLTINKWLYYVVTVNGSNYNCKVYENGLELNSFDLLNWGTLSIPFDRISVGAYDSNSWVLDGKIANMSFYNRVLTSREIQQNYHSQKDRFGY